MLGAIIGDIAGSRFEFHNHRSKIGFQLINDDCFFTDDTVMTCAVAKALMESDTNLLELTECYMREFGIKYPHRGYGGWFQYWINNPALGAYNSFGNGSAMRVSACGIKADSLIDALKTAEITSSVTHNHPDGIKGAQAIAGAVYLAKSHKSKDEIKRFVQSFYPFDMDFKLDDIRNTYYFDETCQGSVPQAVEAFLESYNFEDAIRNAISIGGDSDTIACMTGAIAEQFYGIPEIFKIQAFQVLSPELRNIVKEFYKE